MKILLFNSTISTPEARFVWWYIKKFYLGTPVEQYEYISLLLNIMLEEIIKQYNLRAINKNVYIYAEIRK